jgi:sortase A
MRLRISIRKVSILFLISGIAVAFQSYSSIKESVALGQIEPMFNQIDNSFQSINSLKQFDPKTGDSIGFLEIPRLERVIPIIEGTGTEELKIGAGHYIDSALPGLNDNSVISGHRDTHFSGFGSLKVGDLLNVTTPYGKYTYYISAFRIVSADDRTVIVPTDVPTLTLSTCYPFRFIGTAPKRFVVTALLVS